LAIDARLMLAVTAVDPACLRGVPLERRDRSDGHREKHSQGIRHRQEAEESADCTGIGMR